MKTIRLPQAIALYIGAVLGAGILLVPGLAAQVAGPASLIDWGLLVVLVLPMALCMAYLSQKFPHSGGVSYFVTEAFGQRAGQVIGWFFLMSVPIGAPVTAITGSAYLGTALGLPEPIIMGMACVVLLIALVLNYLGMRIAGKVQVAVITGILVILCVTLIAAFPHLKMTHFTPFMTKGPWSVGHASTLLFWCFIGWEAITNYSAEFVDPEKDIHRATVISAIILGCLYFLTALIVVGTESYQNQGQAALVTVSQQVFGQGGAIITGIAGLLICLATVIAYIGSASRMAYAMAKEGSAPRGLMKQSQKYQTPVGGLLFLAFCFILVMIAYSTQFISLTKLIQLPNATFLLNYMGGCAAGLFLFRGEKKKFLISLIAFLATLFMFLFVGSAILYPIIICLFLAGQKMVHSRRKNIMNDRGRE
ncbi:amino acid permease [Sporolactobacillus shoreicorticis]|uniref:APC family permease n=1 Tax=Sporolactobacillus shoreicorticis TaxID=1923877 RepID=A0ABW5S3H2_9BACL|nr:amino acid permease [Sporolactobacillus shoreicorticis]MCO7126520.1 amino acid permease [Sporolactobacillus shoreicorticis]